MISKPIAYCTKCPYHNSVFVAGEGPTDAEIMLVGEAPGVVEVEKGRPFVGRTGKLLDLALRDAGLNREDLYITNAIKCHPPNNETPKYKTIDGCQPVLEREIREVKPKVVVPLGGVALRAVEGRSGITNRRNTPQRLGSIISLPGWHPSYVSRQGGRAAAERMNGVGKTAYDELVDCLRAAAETAYGTETQRYIIPEETKYTIITNFGDLLDWYAFIRDNTDRLTFDIETESLRLDAPILGCGFGYAPGRAVYIPLRRGLQIQRRGTRQRAKALIQNFWDDDVFDKVEDIISEILTSGEFRIATFNGTFDLRQMLYHYPDGCMDFSDNWSFDARFAAALIDENRPNSLGYHTNIRYPDLAGFKDETKGYSSFAEIPVRALGKRCAMDCDATWRLSMELVRDIDEQDLSFMMYEWTMPVARVIARMETNGILFDWGAVDELQRHYKSVVGDIDEKIRSFPEVQQYMDIHGKKLSTSSHSQLSTLLYDVIGLDIPEVVVKGGRKQKAVGKDGKGLTNKDVLAELVDEHPIVPLILKRSEPYTAFTKTKGWKGDRYDDDRIHTTFNIAIPRTGRLSSGQDKEESTNELATNVQNFARNPRIRRVITAPEGWTLIHGDFSQAEIWWLGQPPYANDPKLQRAFAEGKDIHCYNLYECLRVLPDKKLGSPAYEEVIDLYHKGDTYLKNLRTTMKHTLSFGVLFGMGIDAMQKAFGIPAETAEIFINVFFDAFPHSKRFRDKMHKKIENDGYIRSAYGRYRRLPAVFSDDREAISHALRQGFNFLVQSAASDMNCLCMSRIFEEIYGHGYTDVIKPILMVHDSMMFEVMDSAIIEAYRLMHSVTQRKVHPDCGVPKIDWELQKRWTEDAYLYWGEDGAGVRTQVAQDRLIELAPGPDYRELVPESFIVPELRG